MTYIPTIRLTNWSSRKYHGGHLYTIMAAPRYWERGEGTVGIIPKQQRLAAFLSGSMSLEEYRAAFEADVQRWYDEGKLAPGQLRWYNSKTGGLVEDGDTLCCSCSRAEAEAGRCHRAWAAPYLYRAGWRVLLDGQEYRP